ncbi:hypothetical protein KR018_010602 [Drosophila ironensis]|nr:hypothetical protein KR018_010602 [Drosophila ironensis]
MRIPDVDMWNVNKSCRLERHVFLRANPTRSTIIDYSSLWKCDMFYLDCQEYRDYFRDPHNRMHKPARFREYVGDCLEKEDLDDKRLREPPRSLVERQPVVFAIEYPKDMALGRKDIEFMKARTSKNSSMAFNRL